MVAKITFDDSLGGRRPLEDFGWLKEKVFSEGDEFWEGATGVCGIGFSMDNSFVGGLDIVGREEFGFMVDHHFANELTLSLRFGELTGETVEAETGGNPDLYFKEYFVPKEIAWQAIEYFLKTGERDPSLTWETAELVETA